MAQKKRRGNDIAAVTDRDLPEPADRPEIATADPETRAAIQERLATIDMSDAGSIIGFGAAAQTELQKISQSMLADVRNKEMGPAGASLREMVTALRGFDAGELDARSKRTLFERLTGRAAPMARFMARYEDVQDQIDRIASELDGHEHRLLKDIKALDQLYDKTLAFFDELGLYIAAGEEKLRRLDEDEIPAAEAATSGSPGMATQELRDLRAARDDLDRRVHDLRLTRQVTMQALPSIRMVQENDKSLVAKINSTLMNTVPLWETQLAQAVTIQRTSEAADAVREATDLTNTLLTRNAENLREANAKVRTEMERGVFDIEAVRAANDNLIATIEESLEIADEGRAQRQEAAAELEGLETDLRRTLSAASARDGSDRR